MGGLQVAHYDNLPLGVHKLFQSLSRRVDGCGDYNFSHILFIPSLISTLYLIGFEQGVSLTYFCGRATHIGLMSVSNWALIKSTISLKLVFTPVPMSIIPVLVKF